MPEIQEMLHNETEKLVDKLKVDGCICFAIKNGVMYGCHSTYSKVLVPYFQQILKIIKDQTEDPSIQNNSTIH